MKFTYYCLPGRMMVSSWHFVYLGGWIHPPGCIVLQHGVFSYIEYKQILTDGFIRVYEKEHAKYTYFYQYTERKDMQEYRLEKARQVGRLYQKNDNIYIGQLWRDVK